MADQDRDDAPMTQPESVSRAIQHLKLAQAVEASQRKREREDLQFQVPDLMWPEDVQKTRQAQIVNGVVLPARPMLSIPKLDQPVQLVLNQERAASLSVSIHPLDLDADDDTAEVLQGLYRAIERDSRANLARTWAFERAVKAGRGGYRILKDYDPTSDNPSDQRIVIKRILHQESLYLDVAAEEPDWSDADWGLLATWMPFARYKARWPKSKLAKQDASELSALAEDEGHPDWVKAANDETGGYAVLVVELFERTYEDMEVSAGDYRRTDKQAKVRWYTVNCLEELDCQDWDGQYIPLIPAVGRELIPFDGERRWSGIIGPNKDAARLFNYGASGAAESAALEPRAPFDVDPEEIEGFEPWWNQANVRNFPYLPRRKVLHGQPTGPLQRVQADTSKMQINMMLVSQADSFLHAGTGAYEPSLGQESPQQRSGKAVMALQQQHEAGSSHYLDNLAEITMTYEAKVILDLIPKVYDRPGRIVKTLDLEGNTSSVMLNQPFVVDPRTKRPMAAMDALGQAPAPGAKHYDLNKGRYGVSVTIGKGYKSRLEEGANELGQLFQAAPQLFQILGDLYLKFRDFPGHEEAAERVKKLLPPPLQQHDQNDPARAQQEAAQLKAQMQQMGQQLGQMADYIKGERAKHEAQIQIKQIEAQTQLALQRMKDATSLSVAEINARAKGVLSAQEAQHEAEALAQEQSFEAAQAAQDRAHEVGMAAMGHDQSIQAAQQAALHGAIAADQQAGAQSSLAAQQAGHQADLAAQQAALAPQAPEGGSDASA